MIRRYDKPTTIYYLDPPYWDCGKYYGKDIFCKEDFLVLKDLLKGIQGKFILSLNGKPEVRELFSGFTMEGGESELHLLKWQKLEGGRVAVSEFLIQSGLTTKNCPK